MGVNSRGGECPERGGGMAWGGKKYGITSPGGACPGVDWLVLNVQVVNSLMPYLFPKSYLNQK